MHYAAFAVLSLIVSVAFPVSGQTSVWTGASGDGLWLTANNWDTAGVPDGFGASAVVGAPRGTFLDGDVNLGSLTVTADGDLIFFSGFGLDLSVGPTRALQNAGAITLREGSRLGLAPTIENSGEIDVNTGTVGGALELRSDVELTGGGTIMLRGPGARVFAAGGPHQLGNINQTIHGGGQLGQNSITIFNGPNGLIQADRFEETLVVDPAAGVGGRAGLTNRGTLSASGSGRLELSGAGGGWIDNTGGVITGQSIGTVVFTDGIEVVGGTIGNNNAGLFSVAAGHEAAFRDVTFTSRISLTTRGNLGFGGGSTVRLLGDTTNNLGILNVSQAPEGETTRVLIHPDGHTLDGGGSSTYAATGPSSPPKRPAARPSLSGTSWSAAAAVSATTGSRSSTTEGFRAPKKARPWSSTPAPAG
ncbi:MAG: hypothetical protein AAFX76_03675 [Planctomycetota bacterium]